MPCLPSRWGTPSRLGFSCSLFGILHLTCDVFHAVRYPGYISPTIMKWILVFLMHQSNKRYNFELLCIRECILALSLRCLVSFKANMQNTNIVCRQSLYQSCRARSDIQLSSWWLFIWNNLKSTNYVLSSQSFELQIFWIFQMSSDGDTT